jgi:hypothetical protein
VIGDHLGDARELWRTFVDQRDRWESVLEAYEHAHGGHLRDSIDRGSRSMLDTACDMRAAFEAGIRELQWAHLREVEALKVRVVELERQVADARAVSGFAAAGAFVDESR